LCKGKTGTGQPSNAQIQIVILAGFFGTVTGPNPKHAGSVLLVVAQLRSVPATKLLEILTEQPSRTVKAQTFQPEGDCPID